MEHPCPQAWNYETHQHRKRIRPRVEAILSRLRSKKADGLKLARDTRAIHGEIFKDLTPPHFTYYAGHYRGEALRCLQGCLAFTPGDSRVGAPPEDVADRMNDLSSMIQEALVAADDMFKKSALSVADKTLHIVELACRVFDLFLQVHPYANGNGHAARFVTWAILGRYNLWPGKWSIEPRPDVPNYLALILQHRAGNTKPLVEHVLGCINVR